jgi:PiT family inorganic phosphate transporter
MSHKITTVTPTQGLSANLTNALPAIFANKPDMPESSARVSVGVLFSISLTSQQIRHWNDRIDCIMLGHYLHR